jgi:HemY protein
MRRLIFYVIILIVAVWLGLVLVKNPGYVLIAYKHWTAETSLWFAIAIVIVGFLIVYYIFKFFALLFLSHGHFFRWYQQKKQIKAHTVTGAGLLALDEADWETAERLLMQGADSSRMPVVNYLAAARAAQELSKLKKRDRYLSKARRCADDVDERIAIGLTKTELQLEAKEYEDAEKTLEKLANYKANHPQRLKLLRKLYIAQENWKELYNLLPSLEKRHVFKQEKLDEIKKHDLHQYLPSIVGEDELKAVLKSQKKFIAQHPGLVAVSVKQAHKLHNDPLAADMIIASMKNDINDELVDLYGLLHLDNHTKQLKQVEAWEKQYGARTSLFNCMAHLAVQLKEWEQAKIYAAESLKVDETVPAYAVLARANNQLGDYAASAQAYKTGLLLVDHHHVTKL